MKHLPIFVIGAILSLVIRLEPPGLTFGQIWSDHIERSLARQLLPDSEHDINNGFFIIPSAEHGNVDPRSGQLELTVVDLECRAGPISLAIERSLGPEPGIEGETAGHRWRFGWDIVLHQMDSLVVIDEPPGTTIFTKKSPDSPFLSATGDRLMIADHSYQRIKRDGTTDHFDNQGRLVSREIRGGHKISLQYDKSGDLTRIEGPYKAYLQLASDKYGRLMRVSCSTGDVAGILLLRRLGT